MLVAIERASERVSKEVYSRLPPWAPTQLGAQRLIAPKASALPIATKFHGRWALGTPNGRLIIWGLSKVDARGSLSGLPWVVIGCAGWLGAARDNREEGEFLYEVVNEHLILVSFWEGADLEWFGIFICTLCSLSIRAPEGVLILGSFYMLWWSVLVFSATWSIPVHRLHLLLAPRYMRIIYIIIFVYIHEYMYYFMNLGPYFMLIFYISTFG